MKPMVLSLLSLITLSAAVSASSVGPIDPSAANERATHIVIGRVEKIAGSQVATVKVISYLKGESNLELIDVSLNVGNGMKDFDSPLKSGDKGVFFLKDIQGRSARLAIHRSVALFDDSPFN